MGYKRTEHKKAIVKMVREKRLILQIDMATLMNKTNINYSIKTLVNEGKIKRQKIKNRGKVGNLTDVWLVYNNDVKQEEILEFEKLMINKPFVSPLVKNHCYKKPQKPIEQELKSDNQISNKSNSKTLEIEQLPLTIITNEVIPIYDNNNDRIVNARDLHEFLGVGKDFTSWMKNRIVKYEFIENEDYILTLTKIGERKNVTKHDYYLKMDTAKEIAMVENNEKGRYIRKYFIQVEKEYRQQNSLEQTNSLKSLDDVYIFMKVAATGITDLNDRVKTLENTMESFKKAITG
jgi:phage anti-repressor protein